MTLEYRLTKTALSLKVIFALLMPFLLLGDYNFVSAQNFSYSSSTALHSAPPITYKFGGKVSANFIKPTTIVSNTVSSVSGYFSTPSLPKGFESANSSSAFYKDVSYIGSVLGFVVNSFSESSSNSIADGVFPNGAVPFDY